MKTLAQATEICSRMEGVRNLRLDRWRELKRFICPYRGIFDERVTDNADARQMLRFTHAATSAVLKSASGMTSGMTPPGTSWFKPEFTDPGMTEQSGARAWLDRIDTLMKECLAAGGFYQAIQNFNLDLIWAGCALIYSETSQDTTLRYECPQPGTWAIHLDREGRLDAVMRHARFSARDIASAFGEGKLSERSKRLLEKQSQDSIKVWNLVCAEADNGPHPFASYWWEQGGQDFLGVSGFYEMPFFYTCWHEGVTPYGTGPGDQALADARQLDKLERHKLEGLAKIIDPPTQAPTDLKGRVRLTAGAINFVPERSTITPIIDLSSFAQSLPHIREEIKTVSMRLEDLLMASIFNSMPLGQRPAGMSATEFLERKREAMQQLGPVISAYEPNVLTPLLFRTIQTIDREGLTPPPPDSLAGADLLVKVEFISPMANALRQTGAETTRALFMDVANMARASSNQEVFDKLDLDQIVDELSRGLGAPGSIVRSDADVQTLRTQRAQQAQAMQAAQAQDSQVRQAQAQAQALEAQASAAQAIQGLDAEGF